MLKLFGIKLILKIWKNIQDYEKAEIKILLIIQHEAFERDIHDIKSKRPLNKNT